MSIKQQLTSLPIFRYQFKFKHLFNQLGIRQKITYGYALAIGIAILGATAGKVIEYYYQVQAKKQLAESQEIILLLNNLQASTLQAHTQTPKLIYFLTEPVRLELEYSRFLEYIAAVNRLLYQTKKSLEILDSEPNIDNNKEKTLSMKNSIRTYIDSIKEYAQKLEVLEKESASTWSTNTTDLVSLLSVTKKSKKLDLAVNKVSQEMSLLITEIQDKEAKTTLKALERSQAIGTLILALGLMLAAGLATLLAMYTSWMIASPIEATTKIAQQVTKESNFTLFAPVTTKDEVGQLTTSLNQLIQRVADYTEELNLAQSQLIQTEKMSSLGQMVAGIAHEINNPINFIYGNIEHTKNYIQDLLELIYLYQDKYPQFETQIESRIEEIELEYIISDLPKILGSMKMGAERIRQLVLSLRNFSRLDEAEVKSVDLHEGIDNTLLILSNRLKEEIEIIKKYGDLPLVECYPAQINQVFMNLLSNAIDALLGASEKFQKQIVIQTKVINSDSIKVEIRDNGVGIPLEIQNKIFDPFFTTKPVGSGTGLGLSVCYQIIEKHGGKIFVKSEPNQGTEFAVSLPIQQLNSL
ncbi:HAMP domain-containing protein [Scytonema sp. UIC 10036]|uniref:sensor histidine kinase n=1 Tax=Scytonema sp. UIC 10036 TaxID=2304196 RepID=UPI0012DAF6DE|nr:ATP-binding protein [Scytonema sp. UIC 10036]MUH01412.1 HAMP domain-containing protein [Scytonema sp. UIC 10036]